MLGTVRKTIANSILRSSGASNCYNNYVRNTIRTLKINRILAYQVDLPLKEKSYNWSGGNTISSFDSTVVQIETDSGVTGYGECTPLGPSYLPAYAEGVRTGIRMLAPKLIGQDPTRLNALNVLMDKTMRGHPYVKSAIDMACWDILGKVSSLSVCELLGGRHSDSPYKLYRAISQDTPENMAANVASYINEGYRSVTNKLFDK